MIRRAVFALIIGLLVAACGQADNDTQATYYLVRHAEKVLDVKDPNLTEAGRKRAGDLALRLKDMPLRQIYSSDYKRTRQTAAPLVEATGLDLIIYDAEDLQALSKRLLLETGHILVVGHSNTTPNLAELLGGEGGGPIVEATEYDRLYILKRNGNDVTGHIERFGDKS